MPDSVYSSFHCKGVTDSQFSYYGKQIDKTETVVIRARMKAFFGYGSPIKKLVDSIDQAEILAIDRLPHDDSFQLLI